MANPYAQFVQPDQANPYAQFAQPPAPAAPATAAPAPAAPVNQGMDAPTYVAQRADRGIADVLGAPVDLATLAMNAGLSSADLIAGLFGSSVDTRVKNPVMGSDWIADKASGVHDALGGRLIQKDEVSPGIQLAGEAARFGTAAAVPSAGLAAKGTQMANAVPAGRLQELLRGYSAPYTNGAGRQFAGDVAAGAGSGTVMESYNDYVPDSVKEKLGPVGDVIAAVVGAIGGSTASSAVAGGSRAASKAIRAPVQSVDPNAPINPNTGKPHTAADMDMSARIAQQQPTNRMGALDNIDASLQDIAGATGSPQEVPTLGMLADDIGVSMQENTARTRDPRRFLERDNRRRARASELTDQSVPAGAEGRDFTDRATQLYDRTIADAETNVNATKTLKTNVDSAAANANEQLLDKGRRQGDASVRLSEDFDRKYTDARNTKNELYSSVPDDTPISGARIQSQLDAAAADVPRAAREGSTDYSQAQQRLRSLVEEVDSEGDIVPRDITYGDAKVLRAEISAARKEAVAAGRDVTYLDRVGNILSEHIDETNPAAAANYRDNFAPKFKTGRAGEYTAAKKRAVKTGEESSATRPSEFGNKFLAKGEDAAALDRAIDVNGDPVTAANARDWMLGDLANSGAVSADGVDLKYDRVKSWADKRRAVLDQFPEIRREIDQEIQRASDGGRLSRQLALEVAEAEKNLDTTKTDMRRSALHSAIGNDPKNAVASVMGSGDPDKRMGELIERLSGDAQATDGLKAATRDWIKQKAGTTGRNVGDPETVKLSRANLTKIFRDHEQTLAKLYSPDEMNALRQAHKLLDAESALDVRATAGSNTLDKFMASQKDTVTGRKRMLEAALKAKFGVLKGGGVFRTINLFLDTLPTKPDAIEDILFEMHFNPELAKHLLTRPVEEMNGARYNAKLNRLLAAATGGRASGEEE